MVRSTGSVSAAASAAAASLVETLETRTLFSGYTVSYSALPKVHGVAVLDVSHYNEPPAITVNVSGKSAQKHGANIQVVGGVAYLTVNLNNSSQGLNLIGTYGSSATVNVNGKKAAINVRDLFSNVVINGKKASVTAVVDEVDSLTYNGGAGNDVLVSDARSLHAFGNYGKLFNVTVGTETEEFEIVGTSYANPFVKGSQLIAHLEHTRTNPPEAFVQANDANNVIFGGRNPFTLGASSQGHHLAIHGKFYQQN